MIERGASDLHISTGSPPRIRVDGGLVQLDGEPLISSETNMCYSILTDAQKQRFEEDNELDLSFGVKGLSRFRANVFLQRGAVAGAFRTIPFEIKSFRELGLPDIVVDLTKKPRGLILVTGPTGSGKSTTLAAVIDKINENRKEHIITIEDPIEFLHSHKQCLINQREVHADTDSFKSALRRVLRQDPDIVLIGEMRDLETIEAAIVLIGEMRDLETIEAALTVSETGHLTFATLHTNTAVQSINRIVDIFPPHQQEQVRVQLSFVLECIISQNLIPRKGGGRVLASEIMVPNAAIRNLIREDKVHQLYSMMQTGQSKYLYSKGRITYDDAMSKSPGPDELLDMMQKASVSASKTKTAIRR
jgi:twitching motility protein PilT